MPTFCPLGMLWRIVAIWSLSIVNTHLLSETSELSPSPVHHEDAKATKIRLVQKVFVSLRGFVIDRRSNDLGSLVKKG